MLLNLSNTLKNIDENPNVANDDEFTERLEQLSDEINELLLRAHLLRGLSALVSRLATCGDSLTLMYIWLLELSI